MGWRVPERPSSVYDTAVTSEHAKDPRTNPRLARVVLDDLRRGDLRSTLRRDLRELYLFYLDEDTRKRLAGMGRVKRWFLLVIWLAKSLFLNLPPLRRVLLVLSFLCFFMSTVRFQVGTVDLDVNLIGLAFFLVLVVLMLELKDKLLARDELETGRAVQRSLFPESDPEIPGWEVRLYTRSANEVGGDLVDYLWVHPERRLGVALGDVSGKGLGAALLMAKLQATLRALATDAPSLPELAAGMNAIFCRDQVPGRYATLLYLELEPGSGAVRLLNAGHLPPLVLTTSGVRETEPVARPIGMLPDSTYREQTVSLEPGDGLLVYSDGVTEARNAEGDFFGDARLHDLAEHLRIRPAAEGVQALVQEVEAFTGEEPQSDDLSLVWIKRVPVGRPVA